jgi:4-amino-4-deoxy-L-arabinose transferase-like glycosyltransferase
MRRRFSVLFLLALALGIYVGTSAWPALLDDADSAHAVAAREILQTGNWTVLHINGVRYLEKPPFHYWLVAASYALFGPSTFSTRLPLALAVVGLVLVAYAFGRHFFGERAGFYSGLVMCTSAGVFLFTRIMIPDAIYALEFLAAFYLFLRAWTGTLSPRWGYWGAAAMIALAVLTRSLVGVVFPVAILGLFLLLSGQWKRWRELPLVSSTLIFLAIALPWHILAELRVPHHPADFFWFYFLNEQVFRALGWRYPADYSTVPLGIWLALHLVWFFPWSFFLPYALAELPRLATWRKLNAEGQARLLLFIWVAFILAFFSWTKSRMEYYSWGAWPAIAILLGLGLARAEEQRRRWLVRLQAGLALAGVVVAALLGAMLWVSRNVRPGADISALLHQQNPALYRLSMTDFLELTPQSFADLRLPSALTALCLLVGFGAAWLLRKRGRALAANLAVACTMAAFLFCADLGYRVFEPHLSSRPLADVILKYLRPGDQIAIYGEFEGASSVGFYTGRRILLYNGCYNGLAWGSHYADAPKVFLDDHTFPPLWDSPTRVFLIVPKDEEQAALVRLPPDSTYLLREIARKAIYTNHPLAPNEHTLAELGIHIGYGLPPRLSESDPLAHPPRAPAGGS